MERRDGDFGLKKIYAKVSAENAEDLIFRNHALFELGALYLEKCDFPNAIECLEKVKTEALQFHLYDNYFRSISMLLRIHAERLDFEKHESLLREVIQVGASLSNYKRYAPKLHYNQGIAASYRREMEEAEKQFTQAEKMAFDLLATEMLTDKERDELRRDHLNAEIGLAIITKDKQNHEDALARLDRIAKDIFDFTHGEKASEHLYLHDLEASVLVVQGQCFRELKQYQKALDKYWAAHAILKAHRNWSYYYYVLLGLGRIYLAMEDASRAAIFFDLINDAISNLELNALKRDLQRVNLMAESNPQKLMIDRERKLLIEKDMGEIHFERRFVLLEILYLLASEPGRVFSKEELVDRIWRESYNPMIHDSKVYTSISRLRKLIEPDFKRPRYILNERDGYAFNSSVIIENINSQRGAAFANVQPELMRKQPQAYGVERGMV